MKRRHFSRRASSRRCIFEQLESRVVLDAGIGAWEGLAEPGATNQASVLDDSVVEASSSAISRFSSAEEIERFLLQDAANRYGHLFGQPTWGYGPWSDAVYLSSSSRTTEVVTADFSGTNVQVAGVDEGDLIKTDGRYLYVARQDEFSVVDVRTPESPNMVARQSIDGEIQALYLTDHRLTVISRTDDFTLYALMWDELNRFGEPWQSEPTFQVTVFDVSSPETPAVIGRFELDGQFSDSRLLGETIYLVSQSDFYLPAPTYFCSDVEWTPEDAPANWSVTTDAVEPAVIRWMPLIGRGNSCVYETEAAYFARIEGQILSTVLPAYTMFDADDEIADGGLLADAGSIFRPYGREHDRLLSVTAIDLTGTPAVVDAVAVPAGSVDRIYMSLESLYVAVPTALTTDDGQYRSAVGLVQFALQGVGGGIELNAQGVVAGWLPSVFAMDEYDGYFRIVTQEGWGRDASTHLYVLEAVDGQLLTVGDLSGLAPGERLHSVRFMGDQAFVVTFGPIGGNWIDPLWTIDISNPTDPRVIGELEIPGFSDYLHWTATDQLVGLGRDADIETGRWLAPQLSLFDVSEFEAPRLSGRVTFGDADWSWSEAFADHHAVSYFPESGVLAIPMTTIESRPMTRNGQRMLFQEERHDLWVFQISANTSDEKPIQVLGQIEHDSPVRRSVRIGAALYSVSHDEIQVHPLLDPATRLARLPLGPLATSDYFQVDASQGDHTLDVLANDLLNRDGSGQITGVSETEQGGLVSIAGDGQSLLYTPPEGFVGWDRFTYVASGHEGQDKASVEIEVLSADDRHPSDDGWEQSAELAVDDLARRLGVQPVDIGIESVEDVEWPNGCLGNPDPSLMCIQVIVPGYRLMLSHEGRVHVYHTDRESRVWYAGPQDDSEPIVRIRLEAVDAEGNPITRIQAGESFVVNVSAEDLRPDAQGVFAVYVDVLYQDRLLRVDGDIEFGQEFSNGQRARVGSPGLISEIGAFGDFSSLGAGQRVVARIPVLAERTGLASLAVAIADNSSSEVLLYGANEAVPQRRIVLVGTELTVRPGWHNFDEPTDVNQDGLTSAQDALVTINSINRDGIRPLGLVPDDVEATPGAAHYFLDVNRDGHLSPWDTLLTVNALNAAARANSEAMRLSSAPVNDPLGRIADEPLAAWLDWPALIKELSDPQWQAALDSLQVSAADAARLAHRLLIAADVRVQDLFQSGSWWSESETEAVRQIWRDYQRARGGAVTIDQAVAAIQELGPLLEQLDVDALLPGLAKHVNPSATDMAIRDAVLAQFDNPASWLAVLGF
ncbi:MAG: beta-propeller domain-containing protein [Pirellulaceae bacterium]|nr:beta-propeller domain-containing protein [Pirellulaceae bacterium]